VSSQLTKVVAELRQSVVVRGQTEGSENGLVDLGGPPSVELSSGVQQHFHQPNYAGVMYFDAGDFGFTGNNGEREPLKQRKVHVNVQRFRLETSKAIGNGDESLAHCFQVVQPFFETEVFETIDADLQAKEGRELFVHAAHEAFAVNPQHMMAVVQFVEETGKVGRAFFWSRERRRFGPPCRRPNGTSPSRRSARIFCGSGNCAGRVSSGRLTSG